MATSLPSLSNNTGTLSAAGVGSGLDVKSLISQLMAVEQRPLTLLDTREARFQARLSALGSVGGNLTSLQTLAQNLGGALTSMASASSGDTEVLSAAATASAQPGSYSIEVSQLAQAQKLVAPSGQASLSAAIGSGAATTVTITLGSTSGSAVAGQYASATFSPDSSRTPVTLTLDGSNNSLAGIRDAINAAQAGVSAALINDGGTTPWRLSLTSLATGQSSSMKITVSGDASLQSLLAFDPTAPAQNLREQQPARNAQLSVDGVPISAATNSVRDAIPGVTLGLLKTTSEPLTVTVQLDKARLTSTFTQLVNTYNQLNKAVSGATAKGAVLQGDTVMLGLQRQLRSILGDSRLLADGSVNNLSQLGIGFQRDGTLALDSSRLSLALGSNPADVASLAQALGERLGDSLALLLGPEGAMASKTSGLNQSIRDIASQRVNLQNRLVTVQARYQAQFNALDRLLAGMSQTSSFLTQQLQSLSNLK